MLIRCTHCGYQNNEHYRFCGMCGALLRLPEAEPASGPTQAPAPSNPPAAKPPQPPPRNLDYLLEDEPEEHGHHGRMYLALALLLIAGVVLAWQWYRGGYSRPQPTAATATPSGASASSATTPARGTAASGESSGSQVAAAPSEPARTTAQEGAQSPVPEKSAPVVTPSTGPETVQAKETDSAQSLEPQPAAEEPKAAPALVTKPASAPKTVPAKPAAQPSTASATPPAAATSAEDRLVADGEKYLYGTGVTQNCVLAQKNLRAAAQHANPKAQSILGTMYATGHCVDRDLPMAYRWFAKALHQDPSNDRIQRDLEVLWRQMTPDEKQLATRSQ